MDFYKKYDKLSLKITFFLISLQIIHLYWMTTAIVLPKIFGGNFFPFPEIPVPLFVFIDYIEIPALISGIIFYSLNIYRKGKLFNKNLLFVIMLAVQILHIFWITDEVLYQNFVGHAAVVLPLYLAWTAILIDYLELPVMADLFYKIITKKKRI